MSQELNVLAQGMYADVMVPGIYVHAGFREVECSRYIVSRLSEMKSTGGQSLCAFCTQTNHAMGISKYEMYMAKGSFFMFGMIVPAPLCG